MNWENERYVRLYTRDTVTWKLLPWQGKCLFPLLLKKVNLAGVMDLDSVDPVQAVSAMTDIPEEVVAPGLAGLMKVGVVKVGPAALVIPKYIEAQEAATSDIQRKRNQRERDRDRVLSASLVGVTDSHASPHDTGPSEATGQTVTKRDHESQNVTESHALSQAVTPSLAEPSLPTRGAAPQALPTEAPSFSAGELGEEIAREFARVTGAEFDWNFDEENALRGCLKRAKGNGDTVLAYWGRALRRTRFPLCRSLKELAKEWNHYAADEPSALRPKDPTRGHLRAENMRHDEPIGEVKL